METTVIFQGGELRTNCDFTRQVATRSPAVAASAPCLPLGGATGMHRYAAYMRRPSRHPIATSIDRSDSVSIAGGTTVLQQLGRRNEV